MEASLRNRLTFGPLMLLGALGLLWFDHAAEVYTRGWLGKARPEHGIEHGIGGIGLLILLIIILPPANVELATLFTAEKVRPYRFLSAVGSGALVVHAFLTQFDRFRPIAASSLAFILVFTMLFAALRRAWKRQSEEAITHMAGTVLSMLYLGGLAWFLMALRVKHSNTSEDFHGSTMLIVMILLSVKFTDIGAYFGGRALGRHKMIPWLSPGKTWEGLVCGLITAGFVSAACSHFLLLGNPPAWLSFIFGVIIGGIGQLGDLLESLMKRDAQVKDSGRLIPGFGGIMDVIDSPLLAAPFAYLLFSLFWRAHL